MQAVLEWIGLTVLASGYRGKTKVLWYNGTDPDRNLAIAIREGLRRDEVVLLYRCSDQRLESPPGHYWRLMPEHPSMRVYQLEAKAD